MKKLSTTLRCTEGMQAVSTGLYNEMKPLKSLWPKCNHNKGGKNTLGASHNCIRDSIKQYNDIEKFINSYK